MDRLYSRYGLRGRKDRLWLCIRFCERARLNIRRQSGVRIRFGYAAYGIDIPVKYPVVQALRIARSIRSHRKLLRLMHEADGLLRHAGVHRRQRRFFPSSLNLNIR